MADVPLMNNPMTTAGDIITGGASGAPARLGIGAALQHLRVNAGATALEYADPPSAGSSDLTIVRKTSNETVNGSSALQNDDELLLALGASEVWQFQFLIFFTSGATPDFKAAITVPASATLAWAAPSGQNAAGTGWGMSMESTSGTARDFISGSGTRFLEIVGYVANSTNAGNLQLQWAQNTSNGTDTIVLANSVLKAWQLA